MPAKIAGVLCGVLLAAWGAQRPAAPPAKPPAPPQQRDLRVEKDVPEAAPPAPRIPRSYALVVGIAGYQNLPSQLQLRYAERDAEAVYSILISAEGGNFPAENVRRLIGPRATLAALRRDLEQWLPAVAREDDRVLIYFAGHGFVFGGQAYLAPYDVEVNNIAATTYAMDTLGALIGSKIRAKWKVLLTDACHSGAINPEGDNATINRSLLDLSRSLFSLSASRDRERSFESPDWGGGHGIFTYYVVKGLEGASDENRDGIVTADELAEYVRRNVREATGARQNPTSDRASFDPNMLLAYIPSNVAAGAPPPPKFGTLVLVSNMDGVEVFVDGKSVGVVNKGTPLTLPGLVPGTHTIKAVKSGYEPDGPREQMVYPGQPSTVTLRIQIQVRRKKAAVELFDQALELYNRGGERNYRRATELLAQAIGIEPRYQEAFLYLARVQNALFDETAAEKSFRQAIEIDPGYLEARASFAGMLLDVGNMDEAIRQLNFVVQRHRNHAMANYLLAQAFRMKDQYQQSIEHARAAIRLEPNNAEAHFWLAESLRLSGQHEESKREYLAYLRLSNFDSSLARKINYYALGFLAGKFGQKTRASQHDIWKDLRSLAYFGLCDAERVQKRYDAAIGYCQKSLSYYPDDPYVHYVLGLCYARKYQETGQLEALPAARQHFRTMLALNADLAEADYARKNLASIDAALAARP
jgi:tetratricopeptide (TPR) repeat protein